jgi:copper chaperone CopZ
MKHLTLFLTLLIMSFSVPVYAGQSAKVDVNGLVCDFCARALEKVFGREDAVSDIDVDLDEKIVTINFNDDQTLDDDTITELITHA